MDLDIKYTDLTFFTNEEKLFNETQTAKDISISSPKEVIL